MAPRAIKLDCSSSNGRFAILACSIIWVTIILVTLLTQNAPALGQESAGTKLTSSAPGDPSQRVLIIGISEQPPFCIHDGHGNWSGITVDLWRQIAEKLKLRYELRPTDLAGIVKGMDDRTYDLEVCPAFITDIGEQHVDFSAPYFVDDTAIAINADQRPSFMDSARATLSSTPLLLIICAIAAITVGGGVVLWLVEHKGESEHYSGKTRQAFLKSLYWSYSVLSGRDFPSTVGIKAEPPGTVLGRTFALAWTLVGLSLFSLVTAAAASLLTSHQLQAVVTDWDDLKRLRVGTVEQSDAQEYLHDLKIKSTSFDTPLQLVTALTQHRVDAAVFGRAGLVYYGKTAFQNKVFVLPLRSPQSCMGLPMQLGFPLRKRINQVLLHLTASKEWSAVITKYQEGS